jgi:hypothetical protein
MPDDQVLRIGSQTQPYCIWFDFSAEEENEMNDVKREVTEIGQGEENDRAQFSCPRCCLFSDRIRPAGVFS